VQVEKKKVEVHIQPTKAQMELFRTLNLQPMTADQIETELEKGEAEKAKAKQEAEATAEQEAESKMKQEAESKAKQETKKADAAVAGDVPLANGSVSHAAPPNPHRSTISTNDNGSGGGGSNPSAGSASSQQPSQAKKRKVCVGGGGGTEGGEKEIGKGTEAGGVPQLEQGGGLTEAAKEGVEEVVQTTTAAAAAMPTAATTTVTELGLNSSERERLPAEEKEEQQQQQQQRERERRRRDKLQQRLLASSPGNPRTRTPTSAALEAAADRSSAQQHGVGSSVECEYNGEWFAAAITGVNREGLFKVKYDDGAMELRVGADRLRVPEGQQREEQEGEEESDYSPQESARWQRRRQQQRQQKQPQEQDGHNFLCQSCGVGGELLCCDTCNLVYHLPCLDPPLAEAPEGMWHCPECICEQRGGGQPHAGANSSSGGGSSGAGKHGKSPRLHGKAPRVRTGVHQVVPMPPRQYGSQRTEVLVQGKCGWSGCGAEKVPLKFVCTVCVNRKRFPQVL
jgi:hypothetical protein